MYIYIYMVYGHPKFWESKHNCESASQHFADIDHQYGSPTGHSTDILSAPADLCISPQTTPRTVQRIQHPAVS